MEDAFSKASVAPLVSLGAAKLKKLEKQASDAAAQPHSAVPDATTATSTSEVKQSRKRKRSEQREKQLSAPLDSAERLSRTLFFGNVPTVTKTKKLAHFIQAALGPLMGTEVPAATSSAAAAAAAAADDEIKDDAEQPEVKGDSKRAHLSRDIESIRFRSVALQGVAIAPGGNYKKMRKAAFIKGNMEEGRAAMNAYVVFRSAAAATAALTLNGALFEGRHLRVDKATAPSGVGAATATSSTSASAAGEGPPTVSAPVVAAAPTSAQYDPKRSVFVGNLGYDADEEEVRSFFAGLVSGGDASIQGVRLVRDKVTNKGKGIGFVLFGSRTHVAEALGGSGQKCCGRVLRVTRCGAGGKGDSSKHAHGHDRKTTKAARPPSASGAAPSTANPSAPAPAHMGSQGRGAAPHGKPGSGPKKHGVVGKSGGGLGDRAGGSGSAATAFAAKLKRLATAGAIAAAAAKKPAAAGSAPSAPVPAAAAASTTISSKAAAKATPTSTAVSGGKRKRAEGDVTAAAAAGSKPSGKPQQGAPSSSTGHKKPKATLSGK